MHDTDFTPGKAADRMQKTTTRQSSFIRTVRVTRSGSKKETPNKKSERFPQMTIKQASEDKPKIMESLEAMESTFKVEA